MHLVYWRAARRTTSGKGTWGEPPPLIELFCIFDQSSYDELKIFPTITTLDEKQAKHLASGQEDKLITREERTVCYWFILITPYTDSMRFRKRIEAPPLLLMISFIVNTCLLTIGNSLIGHTLRNVVTSQKNVCGKLASVWNEKVRAEAKSEQIRPVARYLVESNEYWESIKINLTMFCKKFIDQCTYDRWQQM